MLKVAEDKRSKDRMSLAFAREFLPRPRLVIPDVRGRRIVQRCVGVV